MNNKRHYDGKNGDTRVRNEAKLTCENRIPLLRTDGTVKCDKQVTPRVDGSDSRVGKKVVYNKTTELRNRPGATLEVSSFELILTIVESLLH